MNCQTSNPFFYPGEGERLREMATNTTLVEPADYAINTTKFAGDPRGNGDALSVIITAKSTVIGAGSIKIYLSPDFNMANKFLHATVDMTGMFIVTWQSATPLNGIIFVENTTGVTLTITLQKRIQ